MTLTKRQAARLAEWTFVTFGIFMLTNGLAQLLEAGLDMQGDSNPRYLIASMLVYSVAAVLIARRPGAAIETLRRRPELVLLILLPIVSSLWAVEHAVVFRRAAAQALTVVFCLYLAERLSPEDFIQRLLLTLLIGGVASLVLGALHTSFAVTPEGPNVGAWRGIYGHKAFLGRIAAIAIFTALVARPRTRPERLIALATIPIFAILCLESQSRSSWFQVIGGFGLMGVLVVLRAPRVSAGLKLICGAALGAVAVFALLAAFTDLLSLFGRTATFSGRTSLWNGAIHVAAERHPWLGAGYRGFWLGDTASQVHAFVAGFAKVPEHAHNGYLDTWFELGWVGVALLTALVLLAIVRLLRKLLAEPTSRVWMFFLLQIGLFLGTNLSATVAFRHSDISWALVILASIYTARPRRVVYLVRQAAPAPKVRVLRPAEVV